MLHLSWNDGQFRYADVSTVRVVQDDDPTQVGDDFLRVCCDGDEETGVFTTIERVVGRAYGEHNTGIWRLRRLFDGLLASQDDALRLATAYAEHKGIPVVYAETRRR